MTIWGKWFLLELQTGRLCKDLQHRKTEVVMHGPLKITSRNHAQNCCEEIYRPTELNLCPTCAGFQRPLQLNGCPIFSLLTKLCDPGRVWIRSQSRLYTVWLLLIIGSVHENNLSHNKIDRYSALSQEKQTMKALIIIARWDRHTLSIHWSWYELKFTDSWVKMTRT
jgi:hypothetical protein